MRLFIAFLFLVLLAGCASQADKPMDEQSSRQLRSELTAKHPSAYFYLAQALWEEGEKDEAVVMFYVGQLRYRAYINTLSEAEAVGEEKTYDRLQAELGDEINEYAGRDLDNWVQLIDRALEWHRNNPSEFLPKDDYTLLYELVAYDFQRLREYIVNNKAFIRAKRAEQGLENVE